ncbi:MAG: hypothetical protein ACHQAY_22100, partial [Hyphomicrobiales bacterium]
MAGAMGRGAGVCAIDNEAQSPNAAAAVSVNWRIVARPPHHSRPIIAAAAAQARTNTATRQGLVISALTAFGVLISQSPSPADAVVFGAIIQGWGWLEPSKGQPAPSS